MWARVFLVLFGVALAVWLLPQDDMLHTLKGKRVLVTGSSKGIGEQIAYHYARLGAHVVITARSVDRLQEVVKECQSISPSRDVKHFAVPADMSKVNDTLKVIEQAIGHLGGLDVLVLNHIIKVPIRPYLGTPEDLDTFRKVMDVDFRSYVYLATHSLPELMKSKGSIIVVNSLMGKMAHAKLAAYAAAKHALNGFFSSLKNQFILYGHDVSITSCHLGLIGTESALKALKKSNSSVTNWLPSASPNTTALNIVKGGAMRVPDVYTPYMSSLPSVLLYQLVPSLMEIFIRSVG